MLRRLIRDSPKPVGTAKAKVPIAAMKLTERATALMLVPAMMLVFMVLAAIAVDLSAIHMTQRRASAVLAVAADDAAGMLDERALQVEGILVIDEPAAARVASAHISTSDIGSSLAGHPTLSFSADRRGVTIEAELRVHHVFLDALPGIDPETVRVRSSARLTG